MKATLSGKIVYMTREIDKQIVKLEIKINGKVDTPYINSKDTNGELYLVLKTLVADEMKLGDVVTVIVSNEE